MVSTDDGVSPLALAVEKERLDAAKYLVAEFKVNPEGEPVYITIANIHGFYLVFILTCISYVHFM